MTEVKTASEQDIQSFWNANPCGEWMIGGRGKEEEANQFFDRFETQLKQVLREGEIRDGQQLNTDIQTAANLILSCAEGKISHFVRSNFNLAPTKNWTEQWELLRVIIFHHGPQNRI